VKGIDPTWHSKLATRLEALSSETLMGTRKDLLKLTFNPVEDANW
jgi:hypothetical protein